MHDDSEKVELWRRRFFEAQASAEEFIVGRYGDEGISDWTDENARITARLIRSRDLVDGEEVSEAFLRRLHRQLSLYDSEIEQPAVEPNGARVLTNRVCGILRYRINAEKSGVALTFKSPCGYCQSLNVKIYEALTEPETGRLTCTLEGAGCRWNVV